MDELLHLAAKGGDIDGQVLAYLELAQVCSKKSIHISQFKASNVTAVVTNFIPVSFFFCSSTMPSNYQLGVSITSALIIIASAASFPKT